MAEEDISMLSADEVLSDLQRMGENQLSELAQISNTTAEQISKEDERAKSVLKEFYTEQVVDGKGFYLRHFPDVVRNIVRDAFDENGHPLPAAEIVGAQEKLTQLDALSSQEIHQGYLALHNEAYNKRIESLLEGIDPDKKDHFKQVDIVVCISARNEVDLEVAYSALRNSYGDAFDQEVGVLLYHNYEAGNEPSVESAYAVESMSSHSNVIVVEEALDPSVRLSEVKKTASDLVLHLVPEDKNATIVFSDADLVDLSDNALQESIKILHQRSGPFNAVTAPQNPDINLEGKFPLLYNYMELNNYTHKALVKSGLESPRTVGSYIVTDKRSFEAAGGWMPEELHEDLRLTTQLNLTSLAYVTENSAVVDVQDAGGVTARFNPDREIETLLKGIEGSRYLIDNYLQLSGSTRMDWKRIDAEELANKNPLLRGDMSPEGLRYISHLYLSKNSFDMNDGRYVSDFQRDTIHCIQQSIIDFLLLEQHVSSVTAKAEVLHSGDEIDVEFNLQERELNGISLKEISSLSI